MRGALIWRRCFEAKLPPLLTASTLAVQLLTPPVQLESFGSATPSHRLQRLGGN